MNELLKALLEAMKSNGVEIDEEKTKNLETIFNTQISSFVQKENKGLEENKNKILNDLKNLKNKFGDESELERLKQLAAMLEQDEELKLIADGKHEEVFAKRLEKQKTQWETALKTKEDELAELLKSVESLKADKTQMMLSSKVEDFTRSNKLFKNDSKGALELFKQLVSKDWKLNDENELVFKEERISKNGKPFTFDDYVQEDIMPSYGDMFFIQGSPGAGVKPNNNSNPYSNNGKQGFGKLEHLTEEQRDALSDEEWFAMRNAE